MRVGELAFRRREVQPKGADVDAWGMCVEVRTHGNALWVGSVFPMKQQVTSQQLKVGMSRGWSLEEKGSRRAGGRSAPPGKIVCFLGSTSVQLSEWS